MPDQPLIPVAQRTDPERSFEEEVRALRLGDGEVFRGEGILAVGLVRSSFIGVLAHG
jgi:indolepyruvate ferredoxin oxidoreductase alpha subunit